MANDLERRVAFVYGTLPDFLDFRFIAAFAERTPTTLIVARSMQPLVESGLRTVGDAGQRVGVTTTADYDDQLTFLPSLERLLGGFDVVIVRERLGLYAYQATKVARARPGVALYFWLDNGQAFPAQDFESLRVIRDEVTQVATGFIVQSSACRRALQQEGLEPARILTWPHWIPGPRSCRPKSAQSWDPGIFVLAHVGQLEWEEGFGTLIDGVGLLAAQQPRLASRFRLVLCGAGSFAAALRARAVAQRVDHLIDMLSPKPELVEALLSEADAVHLGLRSSRDRIETQTGFVTELMVRRIPVISPRSEVVQQTVGKHRLDYCFNDAQSLCDAVVKTMTATSLVNNLVNKNQAKCAQLLAAEDPHHFVTQILGGASTTPVASTSEVFTQLVYQVEEAIGRAQYNEAVSQIELFLSSEGPLGAAQKAKLYRLVGDCFVRLGDTTSGKEAYLRCCEADPLAAAGYIGLGTACLVAQEDSFAMIHFQKAVSLDPHDEMANLGLGLAFSGLGEYREAVRWIQEALGLNRENTAAIYALVRAATELEDYDLPLAALQNYLDLRPLDSNARYTLCGMLYHGGHYEQALEEVHKNIEADPTDFRGQSLVRKCRRALERRTQNRSGA